MVAGFATAHGQAPTQVCSFLDEERSERALALFAIVDCKTDANTDNAFVSLTDWPIQLQVNTQRTNKLKTKAMSYEN